MVVGFNHNFMYQGAVYHVQTEDGGVKNPQVVTLLYLGGTILSAKKTSYAQLLDEENPSARVEALMKAQHKEMLRRLKDGEFDGVIRERAAATAVASAPPPAAAPASAPPPGPVPSPVAAVPDPAPAPPASDPVPATGAASLDDLILSYLTGGDK